MTVSTQIALKLLTPHNPNRVGVCDLKSESPNAPTPLNGFLRLHLGSRIPENPDSKVISADASCE
jgi:hypothetical protein